MRWYRHVEPLVLAFFSILCIFMSVQFAFVDVDMQLAGVYAMLALCLISQAGHAGRG
jgi:hypothetical protein